jgi:hypothetical protein
MNRAGNTAYLNRGDFEANQQAQNLAVSRGEIAASAEQLVKSAAAQASGSERGELFEYAIKDTVSVPRGEAAMVPIISEAASGEAVSIFNPAQDAKCALYGFRFVNTSGLHLAGGPVTVFRDGSYAGDAQFSDIAPKEARLISYGVDLDLVCRAPENLYASDKLTLRAREGVLFITRRQRQTRRYSFRNKSSRDKTLIVQQPFDANATLVEPAKPFETSPTNTASKCSLRRARTPI